MIETDLENGGKIEDITREERREACLERFEKEGMDVAEFNVV
jgi:hypothetical protein